MIRAGTSGFSYKGWKGAFYPEELSEKKWLAYYAEQLPAVEINNTFYRMPKASVVQGWAEKVPAGFRFAIKASRRITHFKRLKDAGEETEYFLRVTSELGERLGALLFQLPPNLKADLPRLEAFLEGLPEGTPAAFEFRHESWVDDAVHALLRERGLALVQADTDEAPCTELGETGPLLYLRLRRAGYERADLADWASRLAAAEAEDALVFFKHEDAGTGPRLAAELLALAEREKTRRRPRVARPATKERREAG